MFRKSVRPVVAVSVLIITIAVFIYYTRHHPEALRQLRLLSLSKLGLLLALYGVFLAILIWIQRATLALCDLTLGPKESMLVVMYSSIINFFGPLQSGPAFRAAYLKKRHNISLRNYTLATLLYYGFFAAFSGMFLFTYFMGIWALVGSALVVALAPLLIKHTGLTPQRFRKLRLKHVGDLAVATLAQVSTVAVIFYVELGSFGQHISAVPALIYTGAANFALFVSVTPGAIGFRETFLLFSQNLHHISGNQIVVASLIDRGVYILFLAILIIFTTALHAKSYLDTSTSEKARSKA
jgi:uncharacterized membrane protein YbhN (UPF0104 family)